MRILFRNFAVISVILALLIIPFLIFGARMESAIELWSQSEHGFWVTLLAVIGLLAADIFLPTPSSVISTMAGWQLQWHIGTLASWIGMSLGAVIGFALARGFGRPLASWLAKAEDLEQMHSLSDRFGPSLLVITRAVPVFAEACVLLVGLHRLSWRRFMPPVLLSNLGISLAYACFGDFAKQYQWLPLALGVSIGLPVIVATAFRRFLPALETETKDR